MASPTKIAAALTDAQFREFCDRLLALPGKQRTLAGIQRLATEYGITVSHEGARTFKAGPFARYIERIQSGREAREALVAAAGAGVHPLDALEEVAVQELQDHLTAGEDIDLGWVTKQLVQLRSSLTMREDSRRAQTDLERKLRESAARIAATEAQVRIRDEQIAKLQAEAAARAEKAAQAKAALAAALQPKAKGGLSAAALQAIEEAAALL